MKYTLLAGTIALLMSAGCGNESTHTSSTGNSNHSGKPAVKAPDFNSDSAYAFTAQQVLFGPRVPNSTAHKQCADWMTSRMQEYCDTVIVQSYRVTAFDGKVLDSRNIIASFRPDLGNRILLCAHWDTRPWADQDSVRKKEPIDGANDGASGVGILMEVARQLAASKPELGVDIVFFDAEDYGQPDDSEFPPMDDSYCLGSQYWAQHLHQPNYMARYGILLDMAGADQATFTQEGSSMQYAPYIVDLVWKAGNDIGYGQHFINEKTKGIIDDHFYINRLAGIRCIDIIHYDYNTASNFWKHWHTHGDTIDKISRPTLKAVGQTLLEVLYREVNS